MASAEARTAFISHASADAAVAHQLVSALEHAGLNCWIAPRDVIPGALYASEIVRAINECSLVVLVLSAHSAASAHVGKELERASSKSRRIIALRTDATPLPSAFEYFLSESQWIEVGAGGIEPAAVKLVAAVRLHLHSDSAMPSVARDASPMSGVHTAPRLRGLMRGAAALLVAALTIGAVWKFWPAKATPIPASATSAVSVAPAVPARVAEDPSIAVLPFVNMSSDIEQEHFADGLSEEQLNQLAQMMSPPKTHSTTQAKLAASFTSPVPR